MKYTIGIINGSRRANKNDNEKDIEKTFDTIDYSITKIEDSYDKRQSNSVSE